MMNFVKNYDMLMNNNAKPTSDERCQCRACQAEQPLEDVFDEDVLEKAVAMIKNVVTLSRFKQEHPDERVAMMIYPNYTTSLMTEAECEDAFCKEYDELEIDLLYDQRVILRFDEDDVAFIAGVRYLTGPAELLNIDDNGYECSIGLNEISDVIDYVTENYTKIAVDGKTIPAFRLVD